MRKIIIFTITVAMIFMFSCSKYEEGPDFSLRTKTERVANVWEIKSVLVNGGYVNFTTVFTYEEYTKDGDYNLIFMQGREVLKEVNGTWEFYDNKEYLIRDYPKFTFGTQMYRANTDTAKILMLKEKEMRISYNNGGEEYELHYKPYEYGMD